MFRVAVRFAALMIVVMGAATSAWAGGPAVQQAGASDSQPQKMLSGQGRADENELKATYLLNFGKFMYMPTDPAPPRGETFDVCVIGTGSVGDVLTRITANEKIEGHAVRVLKDKQPPDARECEIVFISSSEHARIGKDVEALAGADVLTVSDDPGFLEHGGMIQFVRKDRRLHFSVNLGAVLRTRVTLSSQLLRLAVSITGGPKSGVTP